MADPRQTISYYERQIDQERGNIALAQSQLQTERNPKVRKMYSRSIDRAGEAINLYESKILRAQREQTLIDQGVDPARARRKVRRASGSYQVARRAALRAQERETKITKEEINRPLTSSPGSQAETGNPTNDGVGLRSGVYQGLQSGRPVLVTEQPGPARNIAAIAEFKRQQAIKEDPTYSSTTFYTETIAPTPRRLSNFQYDPGPITPDQPLSPAFSDSFREGAGDDTILRKPSGSIISKPFDYANYYGSRYITRKIMPIEQDKNKTVLDALGVPKPSDVSPFLADVGTGIKTTVRDKPGTVVAYGAAGAGTGVIAGVAAGYKWGAVGFKAVSSIVGGVYVGSVGYETATSEQPGRVLGRESVLAGSFGIGFGATYSRFRPAGVPPRPNQTKLKGFTRDAGATEVRVPRIEDFSTIKPTQAPRGGGTIITLNKPSGSRFNWGAEPEVFFRQSSKPPPSTTTKTGLETRFSQMFQGKGGKQALLPTTRSKGSGPRVTRRAFVDNRNYGLEVAETPKAEILPKVGARPAPPSLRLSGLGMVGAINRSNVGLGPIVSSKPQQLINPRLNASLAQSTAQVPTIKPKIRIDQALGTTAPTIAIGTGFAVGAGALAVSSFFPGPGGGPSFSTQPKPKPGDPSPGLFGFGPSRGLFGSNKKAGLVGGVRTGYAPSLFAITTGLTTSKIPRSTGGFSGLEVRPLIVPKRRGRKK